MNRFLALGSGVGIEIRGEDLAVVIVKSRWNGATVVGRTTLRDFRRRPAAEWGSEYESFLKSHSFSGFPATLGLPRGEVIVRLLSLPAVGGAELKNAVRFQMDTLHPYGDEGVYFSFAKVATRSTASASVAAIIAAREAVDRYSDLFAEAGVRLRGMTVAAAGYYGASRLLRRKQPSPFLLADIRDSVFELYGESEARPFFSATFDSRSMSLEKAAGAAAAELRFAEADAAPLVLCGEAAAAPSLPPEEVLGSPLAAPEDFDLKRDATAFVTALAGACPRWGWRTNLLPPARRSSSARWPVAATAATAAITALVALVLWLRGPVQDRRYAGELNREIKRLEAVERELRGLEQQAAKARSRRQQLENYRRRAEADLTLVTEISRRLPNTVYLTAIETNDEFAQLTGIADSAAPLLGLVDSAGVLTNAAFVGSITRADNKEVFRIRASRRFGPAAPLVASAAQPGH